MRDQYMRCGEGFVICYSISDRHSFEEATEYKKLVNRVRHTDEIPIILVGNKYDLESQRMVIDFLPFFKLIKFRPWFNRFWISQVSTEEGQALARQFNCQFFETSAALRHFVDDVFHALVRQIRLKEKEGFSWTPDKTRKGSRKWNRMKSAITSVFKMWFYFSSFYFLIYQVPPPTSAGKLAIHYFCPSFDSNSCHTRSSPVVQNSDAVFKIHRHAILNTFF